MSSTVAAAGSGGGHRKRSGSGQQGGSLLKGGHAMFKEKVVQMYEVLLRGEDPTTSGFGANFWSDFFLLKPKTAHLEAETSKLTPEQLVNARPNLNRLFEESLANLECRDRPIRIVYALQTLCGLIKAVFRKVQAGQNTSSNDSSASSSIASSPAVTPTTQENKVATTSLDVVINCLVGIESAEHRMQELVAHLNSFLVGEHPSSLKELCLKLLLIICTGVDNVSRNTLVEFLMINSVFESLVHLLSHGESRSTHGHSCVLILTLLVQYRKYEGCASNPYVVKLSILDQEMSLHGYSNVITNTLSAFTSSYEATQDEQPPSSGGGWFSSITSMVGNMFVSEEVQQVRVEQIRARNAVLLALYEAVHLNRHFIATLTHFQTDPSLGANEDDIETDLVSAEVTLPAPTQPASEAADVPVSQDLATAPSNLLVTFLEHCSIVMQDVKTNTSQNTVKLSFLVLTCITEDQYANALLNDPNLVFKVKLHRAPMRHRPKTGQTWNAGAHTARPLACSVMDLMVEFVRSHMMKRFPCQLYSLSLGVIHRLLAYQKRARVRLNYPWKELWTSLISLVKFISSNESNLIKKMNVFAIALQISVIFNLFITYGDTFLPSPSSYDELYYELVRCRSTFDSVYSMALRYSTGGGEYKDTAMRVTTSLINIKAITAHFSPKIDAWLSQQQLSTPSQEQILEVVKANYDSLTLKLQDGLDLYDRYTESPGQSGFFTSLVREVVSDTRQGVVLTDLQLQTVLQDFSSIQ